MKKLNDFCVQYEASIWQLIAAIWFFVYYFMGTEKSALFGAGVFWLVMAVLDFVQKKMKSKKE